MNDIPTEGAYAVSVLPVSHTTPNHAPAKRVAWPDGRIYRHTDGVLCGAGQNQRLLEIEDTPGGGEREFHVCSTHGQEIVLAPRYEHEDDGSDCEASEGQILHSVEHVLTCTFHEQPVRQVW